MKGDVRLVQMEDMELTLNVGDIIFVISEWENTRSLDNTAAYYIFNFNNMSVYPKVIDDHYLECKTTKLL